MTEKMWRWAWFSFWPDWRRGFFPPLHAIVGSVTTSAAIYARGLALIILPTLVVGNELLILGWVGAAVGLWFFAHRYGKMRGTVEAKQNE